MSAGPQVVGGTSADRVALIEALSSEGEGLLIALPTLDRHGELDAAASLASLVSGLDDSAARANARSGGPSPRVLIVSSTWAQPPIYTHAGLVRERPASALAGRHPSSDPWCRWEESAAAEADSRSCAWRCLRPAPVRRRCGADRWNRLLDARRPAVPLGFSPPIQALHLEDFHRGLRWAASRFDDLPPVTHLAPEDAVPLREALAWLGARRRRVPYSVLSLWRRCRRLFGGPAPHGLGRLRYPATVSGETAASLDFLPEHGTASALGIGAPDVRSDPHGLRPDVIEVARRTVFKWLHDRWWRVEVEAPEHLPAQGPALLMGVHRGLVPFDAMMILHAVVGASGQIPRFLIHPALLRFPLIGDFMRALGGVVACRENADWVLSRGEILGLFPEGVRGAFSPIRDAGVVQRFGRAEFVRLAVRHRAPCHLFVTVGSAEVYPILTAFDWPRWKRWSGWPNLPIPATPIPLPVKWRTRCLEPLSIDAPKADRAAVKRYATDVYDRLQSTLDELRKRRRGWFRG
ncbi:MAG: 1-acyl-sn-glycerol-3-phosphate acyltransferase [Acidobacteriota bacterium]